MVARPDRQYYEMIDPEGMEFPGAPYTRRIALVGDHVRIGRRSTTRGIKPEIDLSGTLEDVGVSHRHAVLMRQPDGSWALVDQGSTNGTFLNAESDPIPANQRVPLRAGDQIHVGAWTTLTMERVDVSGSQSHEISVPSKDTRGVGRGRQQMEIRLLGPLEVLVGGSAVPLGGAEAPGRAGRAGAAHRFGRLHRRLRVDVVGRPNDPDRGQGPPGLHLDPPRHPGGRGHRDDTAGVPAARLEGPRRHLPIRAASRTGARPCSPPDTRRSAVAEFARALELWRGEPLPDLTEGPVGAGEVARLSERRASTEEDLFEGRLQLGDHQGVLPDLKAAVEEEPLRERRWAQLMLAMYRSGRQVEALQTFQRYRTILAEEHGVEPSCGDRRSRTGDRARTSPSFGGLPPRRAARRSSSGPDETNQRPPLPRRYRSARDCSPCPPRRKGMEEWGHHDWVPGHDRP